VAEMVNYCLACLTLSLARLSGNVRPRWHSQHTVAISCPACWQILISSLCAVCHRNKKTLCSISNTCDIFRCYINLLAIVVKEYQQYSVLILVSNLSLILIVILKFISNADSDIDTDTHTLISLPHHTPVCRNS